MLEFKFIVIPILLFISWTLVLFISVIVNTNSLDLISFSNKLVFSHFLIWLTGISALLVLLFKNQKQQQIINGQKESQNGIFEILNFFTTPAIIIDKETNEIVMANDVLVDQFNISKDAKEIKIEKLDCLFGDLPKYKDSIIKNMRLENVCYDQAGNELLYEVFLHDLFFEKRFVTLAVVIDKTESDADKNLQEMNEYIEDLQAKEDALEDNASELIQMTIKLEESEKNLKEANANKDKFFSIVAHDLKSPFVGLLGITEMLDTDYDDFEEKERREFIHSLYEISKNTFELLEGLLEWARAKQGRIEYTPKEFNFFQLTDSLTNLLKANAFKKEIKLINAVDVNSIVYADRDMISTVLRNLLANAIKFTPHGGTVEVKAEMDNELLKVSVIDSGIGMTEKSQEKLFRIDVNHTTLGTNQEKGTGLGLILCKELIEKHSTNIWVESEMGKGSKFIFTLPISANLD
jgi:signal transduction histidine kinase